MPEQGFCLFNIVSLIMHTLYGSHDQIFKPKLFKILSERFIENLKNRFNLLERLRVIKCNENKLIEQTRIYKKNSDFLISISLQPNIVDL